MVLKAETDFKTAPWPSVSDAAKNCVRSLLNRDAKKRATASEILQHPWLAQQGVASDKPLDNVVIKRMRQVRQRVFRHYSRDCGESQMGGGLWG